MNDPQDALEYVLSPTEVVALSDEARKAIATAWAASKLVADARTIVDKQAEDEGLWFHAITAPEAYLQQELRRLHAALTPGDPE